MSITSTLRRHLPRALGAWLALAFTLLSIVLTLVILSVIEYKANGQVKESIGNGLAELAMQTSDKLERGMFERYREVKLMSSRPDLVGDAPLAHRRTVLDERQASYVYYGWIGLTDLDGKVLVATQGMLEGANVAKRPWFKNALDGVNVGDVHEAVLLAKLLPAQAEPWRFVDVAFPVLGPDGKPRGVLGAHLSWQWARDVERSMMAGIAKRREVEALIVDARGQVLLGPPDTMGKKLDLASLAAARSDKRWGYVEETWADGTAYLVGFARGRGYDTYPGLGWTVLVRQNVRDAYGPVRRLREYGLAWGLLLALVFSVAGYSMARRITGPLDALARSALSIQRGERVPISSGRGNYNEVRSLARSLNVLVDDLLRKQREVEQLNATLEARVEERTQELARALETVSASEQRIATIVETAHDAYIGVDLRGRICDWNSAAHKLLGWTREEAVGQIVSELIIPERDRALSRDILIRFRETAQMEMLGQRVERVMLRRDGREIPVEMTTGLAGSGENVFFSAFVHDISERKEIERLKDEFVSTVSHELRTPLTAITASLALLADGMAGELPEDAAGLVDVANVSSERLVRLINDVLDLQKMDAGRMAFVFEEQAVLPLAEQAVAGMASFAAGAAVELRVEAGPGALDARASVDRDRIAQVLANLLSNAIKFSGPNCAVVVRVEGDGDVVRLSVTDQGPGIPEAFRARVFQRFAQADGADSRRKGGTGLGLSICKTIVEEHGGTIGFDSVDALGTTFYVTLPAVR